MYPTQNSRLDANSSSMTEWPSSDLLLGHALSRADDVQQHISEHISNIERVFETISTEAHTRLSELEAANRESIESAAAAPPADPMLYLISHALARVDEVERLYVASQAQMARVASLAFPCISLAFPLVFPLHFPCISLAFPCAQVYQKRS